MAVTNSIFVMISLEKRMRFYHKETFMNKLHLKSTMLDLNLSSRN